MVLKMTFFTKLMAVFLFFLALSFSLNIYLLFANRTLANNLEAKEDRFNKLVSSMHVMVKQKNRYRADINYIISEINETVEKNNLLRSEIEDLNQQTNKILQKIILLDVNNTIMDLYMDEHTKLNAKNFDKIRETASQYLDAKGYECGDDLASITKCFQGLTHDIQNDAGSISCGDDGEGHISCINLGDHPLLSGSFSLYVDYELRESSCLWDDIISPLEECRFLVSDCDRYELSYNSQEIYADNCY